MFQDTLKLDSIEQTQYFNFQSFIKNFTYYQIHKVGYEWMIHIESDSSLLKLEIFNATK